MRLSNEEIGEFFRDVRKARSLKLKDLANKQVTLAQLSKFERGETVLSFDRLLSVIDRLNMTFEEFSYMANAYQQPTFHEFYDKAIKAAQFQNVNALQNMLDIELAKNNPNFTDKINQIYIRNFQGKLSDDDKKFVINYLMAVDNWTFYELLLFNDTLSKLKIDAVDTLAKEMISRTNFYKDIYQNKKLFLTILINVYRFMIKHDERVKALFYQRVVEENISEGFTIEKIVFDFIKQIFLFSFADTQTKKEELKLKMQEIVTTYEKLDFPAIAKRLREELDELEI